MFKEIAQFGTLLKQAKSLSGKMQEAQQRIAAAQFIGASADGLVQIELSGQGLVTACRISEELLMPNRQEDIESRVVAAVNSAFAELKRHSAAELSEVTGGLDLGALGSTLGLAPKA